MLNREIDFLPDNTDDKGRVLQFTQKFDVLWVSLQQQPQFLDFEDTGYNPRRQVEKDLGVVVDW